MYRGGCMVGGQAMNYKQEKKSDDNKCFAENQNGVAVG